MSGSGLEKVFRIIDKGLLDVLEELAPSEAEDFKSLRKYLGLACPRTKVALLRALEKARSRDGRRLQRAITELEY